MQPVSATREPNTLVAKETAIAEALTSMGPQRRSDRGDLVVQYWETRVARNGRGAPDDLAHALKAEAGSTGLGDAAPMVLTYHVDKERGVPNSEGISVREVDTSATLTADGDPAEKNDRGLRVVSLPMSARVNTDDIAPTLTSSTSESRGGTAGPQQLVHGMVRRLTPTETERLQYFPDGWTLVTAEEVAYEKKWAALPLEERP